MTDESIFDRFGIQAEDIFRETLAEEYYGAHLFEVIERDHHLFSQDEKGDAVWLIPSNSQDRVYEVLQVEESRKFPPSPLIPSLRSLTHCESIMDDWFEDKRINDIENKIREGGKTLARQANGAFINVLMNSVTDSTIIQIQDENLDEILADIFQTQAKAGFRLDKFIFPEHLEGRLVQQEIIKRDNKFQNTHYVGKTITGQDAFWSSRLPEDEDMAILFASAVGITLTGGQHFWADRIRSYRPTPAVCGELRLNPVVKNVQGVIVLKGIEQALTQGAQGRKTLVQRADMYVDPSRIEELRSITSSNFDLTKLIELCEELNVCFDKECYLAVAMLTRSILDHVPPIFNQPNFNGVANNYGGARSFQQSMQNLSNSSRRIADAHLHLQIRRRETLPNRTQVNFSQELDVLLAEIVRVLT